MLSSKVPLLGKRTEPLTLGKAVDDLSSKGFAKSGVDNKGTTAGPVTAVLSKSKLRTASAPLSSSKISENVDAKALDVADTHPPVSPRAGPNPGTTQYDSPASVASIASVQNRETGHPIPKPSPTQSSPCYHRRLIFAKFWEHEEEQHSLRQQSRNSMRSVSPSAEHQAPVDAIDVSGTLSCPTIDAMPDAPTSILKTRCSSIDASANDSVASTPSLSSRQSSISSSSSVPCVQRVRIDPKIIITRFDDDTERQWWSVEELDQMKRKTHALAQAYLMAHRKVAREYGTPRLDPVTKTIRRRALFSLPVLAAISSTDECLDDDSTNSCTVPPSLSERTFQNLVENQIQTILVVDSNKALLTLLTKSMKIIFPRAHVNALRHGDEALTVVASELRKVCGFGLSSEARHRNFDIIITEESLLQSSEPAKAPTSSFDVFQSLTSFFSPPRFGLLFKNESFSSYSREPRLLKDKATSYSLIESVSNSPSAASSSSSDVKKMAGSEFIQAVLKMEEKYFGPKVEATADSASKPPSSSSEALSVSSSCNCRSLIITTAVRPDHKAMKDAGADLIWCKLNMPSVGPALRDQLLSMIVKKRRPPTM